MNKTLIHHHRLIPAFALAWVIGTGLAGCLGSDENDTPPAQTRPPAEQQNQTIPNRVTSFIERWSGSFEDEEFGMRLNILADQGFEKSELQDVSKWDPSITEATLCGYRVRGKILTVYDVSDLPKDTELPLDQVEQQIRLQVEHWALDNDIYPGTIADSNCVKFISNQQNRNDTIWITWLKEFTADKFRLHWPFENKPLDFERMSDE